MSFGFTKNYRNVYLYCICPKAWKAAFNGFPFFFGPKRSSTPVGTNNSPFCWMDLSGWVDLRVVSFFNSSSMETMDPPEKNLQSGHLTVFRQLISVGFGNSSRVNPMFSLNQINESMSILYAFRCIQSFNHSYRCTEVAKIPIPSIGKENRRTHPLKRN